MEPLKERARWYAGYRGEEALDEMRPLLQEDSIQVSTAETLPVVLIPSERLLH